MKKLSLIIGMMICFCFANAEILKPVAQKISDSKSRHANFIAANILSASTSDVQRNSSVNNVVSNATILEFNRTSAAEILRTSPENLTMTIPSSTGNIDIELVKSSIFTPDFSAVTNTGEKINYSGVHYWGIIKNDNSSVVAISIFDGEMMGMISSPLIGNLTIGKIKGDAQNHHIIYNERDLHVATGPHCDTPDDHGLYKESDLHSNARTEATCIRIYWELNFDLEQDKGSATNATNFATAIFNQDAVLYSNDAIPVTLSQIFVWTSASPYTATSTSSLLSEFQSTRTSFNGDIGNLLGYAGGGGIAASIGGLCGSRASAECYSGIESTYSNVPTYSWTVEVTTHEQGHLLGSRHTHACVWNGNNTAIDGCGPAAGYAYEGSCTGAPIPANGGTIMSYCHLVSVGINFSLGFGPQPKAVIQNYFGAASCLTSCTGTTCNAPIGMSTSAITTTTATFSWTAASGASSYNIQYRVTGTSTWSTGTSSTATFNATGLTANSNYEWQVATVCSGGVSSFTASTNFTTAAIQTCGVPTGMSTTNITTTSAKFNWTAVSGALSYGVQYRVTGTSTWTTGTSSTTSFTANSLTAGSTYEWQVKTVCSSGSSAFTASTNFTTTAVQTCGVPTGMSTTNITTTSAKFNWTAVSGALSYGVQYRVTGTSTWTTGTSSTTSFTANSLTAGSTYEWQVRTVCSGGNSAFTSSTNFTTLQSCGVAGSLSETGITASGATLTWTAVSGASSYNVQWKLSTASTWTTITGITTTSRALTGLASCTSYQFEVQSVCSSGSSAYSSAATFTTTGCTSTYCTSKGNSTTYEYINKVVLGTISNTSGDNRGYHDYTALSTNLSGSTAYTIALTPGFHGSAYREYWTVYIDYNHNGSFADAGEKVATGNSTSTVSLSFTVPSTALNGATRMRVQMRYSAAAANSCSTYTYGEVEDYTVNISGASLFSDIPETSQTIESDQAENILSIYPNPVGNVMTVQFDAAQGKSLLNVYNVTGQKVYSEEVVAVDGENRVQINTSEIKNGIYFLDIENNGRAQQIKFVVNK